MNTQTPIKGITSGSPVEPLRILGEDASAAVLAVITGVEGPSYRPVGAMLAAFGDGRIVGTLSSGCVEADIALKAQEALAGGTTKLRYGRGSAYFDIQLPCGGGLDILLVPNPNRQVIRNALAVHDERKRVILDFYEGEAGIHLRADEHKKDIPRFTTQIDPEIYFCVLGKGPEASTFAILAHSAGYPVLLASPDSETLDVAASQGCPTRSIVAKALPDGLSLDDRSAVVLFFHDHDWEPLILQQALQSKAFYIGAQGSQKTRANRNAELLALGVTSADVDRIAGPIGIIPSVKDARTLAVSVLAEILDHARLEQGGSNGVNTP